MNTLKKILVIGCFSVGFCGVPVLSQSSEKSHDRPIATLKKPKRSYREKVEPRNSFLDSEIISPFRYVIVDNDLQIDESVEANINRQVPVRRFVKVLMDERAFSEVNLIYLFNYLSKFYADPLYLGIEVHTSLMTLETLEESNALSTHSDRDNLRKYYKTASYSRFNDGSAGFFYQTGRPGKFAMKYVKLARPTNK
jgi:hypothetical protein